MSHSAQLSVQSFFYKCGKIHRSSFVSSLAHSKLAQIVQELINQRKGTRVTTSLSNGVFLDTGG
jgi:hypothetical protein